MAYPKLIQKLWSTYDTKFNGGFFVGEIESKQGVKCYSFCSMPDLDESTYGSGLFWKHSELATDYGSEILDKDKTGNSLKFCISAERNKAELAGIAHSAWCLPGIGSSYWTELTHPSSGGSVTAPNDGWITAIAQTSVSIDSGSTLASSNGSPDGQARVCIPVKQGASVSVSYTGTLYNLRFGKAAGVL